MGRDEGGHWHPQPSDLVGDGRGPNPVQYRRPVWAGMGLASLPTRLGQNLVRGTASGVGLVPFLSHISIRTCWASASDGDGPTPKSDKVLGSGMPAAPSPGSLTLDEYQ
jgi:hypothetical protein